MSVYRVTLTASDDRAEPASEEIDITVVGDEVFITVYEGSLNDLVNGRKKKYEVPQLSLRALIHALAAFGDVVSGIHFKQ